jgi:DNA polymerase-1
VRTLLLIDANSIIHRSFHALPPFTAPDGRATGALYGLASILLKLWREEKPDYAVALFDRPEPTFRKKKFEEYKAQRPEAPDELISQIIEAHNLFPKFGIRTFEKPGFEADDLIATLATKFSSGGSTSFGVAQDKSLTASGDKELKVVILTGDLDTLQLVKDGKIAVRTFRKGVSDTMTYDEKAVYERYGLKPNQLVDYKALVGDPSDNIKGVPGIGSKTATDLLQRFGSLDNIYKNLDKDPKLEKRLGPFKKEAELSKELVILEKNVPVEVGGVSDLAVDYSDEPLADYFGKMGFDSLVKRLNGENEAPDVAKSRLAARKRTQPLGL